MKMKKTLTTLCCIYRRNLKNGFTLALTLLPAVAHSLFLACLASEVMEQLMLGAAASTSFKPQSQSCLCGSGQSASCLPD